MELKNYKEGDEYKIIELFELVFKQTMSIEQWYWRFRENPSGKHMIKLMWDGDHLIGHYAVSPIKMNVNGQEILTAHSLTTMTHPEYGGRGIFKALSSELYHELEEEKDCKAIWGFPNNNSHYGFVKSLCWINLAVIHTMGIKASQISTNEGSGQCKSFNSFSRHHVHFINIHVQKNSTVFIDKSLHYLNWRYVSKPAVDYRKYEIRKDGSMEGIIVTKVYPSLLPNLFDLNIVECFLENYESLHEYINTIMKEYGLSFDRVTIWKNLFDPDHLLIEKNGFVPVLPQTYLGARVHHSMSAEFSSYKNWNISMGDSDVY